MKRPFYANILYSFYNTFLGGCGAVGFMKFTAIIVLHHFVIISLVYTNNFSFDE